MGPLHNIIGQKTREQWIEIILVSLIFFVGFGFYLWFYFRFQLMPMIDGPYYLIQVQSLIEIGSLVYGDPPLTFYLLAFTTILVGDVTVGVKLGVAFFCALTSIPAYYLMKRVTYSTLAGLLAMVFILFSPLYIRMLSDFIKNAIGVCWILAFLYFLHDLTFSSFNKRSLIMAVLFLVLTGLTHILAFGVALLFLGLYAVLGLIRTQHRWALVKSLGVLAAVTSLFVVVASVFFSWYFTDFNKVISFFSNLSDVQSTSVSLTAAVSPGSPPMASFLGLALLGTWGTFIILLSVGVVLSIYVWKHKETEALILLAVVTLVGAMIGFPLIPSEYLTRFVLMLAIPITIFTSYGLTIIWRQEMREVKIIAIVLIIFAVGVIVSQGVMTAMALQPTISEAAYQNLVRIQSFVSADSVVVIPNQPGIHYWLEYVINADLIGMGQLSPDLWQTYTHVYGIFFNGQIPSGNYIIIFQGPLYTLVEYQPPVNPIQWAMCYIGG
jgi:4-amino-4-deoxy-L-arabinose transferase-like glycosyltransferase